MTKRLLEKNIHKKMYVVLLIGLVLGRLLIAYCQRVFLLPEGSGLDDMLMLRAAQSITAGDWLGAYGGLAIAKNMGFAVWLAVLHALRMPLLLANAALWVGSCLFGVWALRPVFRGNLCRLVVFAFFAYQPASFAFFTMRAYRDAIFPAFCLLFFAGVVGLALRAHSPRLRGAVACALGAGVGLAAAWLLREDGAVLLPFAICGFVAVVLYLLFCKKAARRFAKMLVAAVPFGVLALGIVAFSAANFARYGVFRVNDMTSGAFPGAYGALAGVSHAETGWERYIPVSQRALEKMYDEVPSLAALKPSLSAGAAYNGFSDPETGEFGGSFYFALRLSAEYENKIPDGKTAQKFWAQMQLEVEQAVSQGRLQSETPSAATLPRWNAGLWAPTLRETGAGALALLNFTDCAAYPAESFGSADKIEELSAYLHAPIQQGYVAGTDQPYFNFIQRVCFTLCSALVWLYRVAVWPMLAAVFVCTLKNLGVGVRRLFTKKRYSFVLLLGVLSLGLLLSAVLRLAVVGYMEAAAFGIGTYIMYLSPALPPLLFCMALSVGLLANAGESAQCTTKGAE